MAGTLWRLVAAVNSQIGDFADSIADQALFFMGWRGIAQKKGPRTGRGQVQQGGSCNHTFEYDYDFIVARMR